MPSSKHPKNWVLTTSQDYAPGGALSLGQVLTNPWDPSSGILAEGTVPIPDQALRDKPVKRGIELASEDTLQVAYRLWLQGISNVVAAGASAQGISADTEQSKFKIDTLMVDMFQPSLDYAKKVLKAGDVPSATQWWRLGKSIFLVTGLRIAKGTSMDRAASSTRGLAAAAEADATPAAVPVKGGAGAGFVRRTQQVESAEDVSEFVFAYRLHEILWQGVLGRPAVKSYKGGETHAQGAAAEEPQVTVSDEIVEYKVVKIADDVFDADELSDDEGDERARLVE